MKILDISTKKYPNTICKIDDEDFAWASQWKWTPFKSGKKLYVHRRDSRAKKMVLMHRELAKPAPDQEVDHVNGDSLDNQKGNLRRCTHTENVRNVAKYGVGLTSKFKGVGFYPHKNKYRARISFNNKSRLLGYFDTEIEAALAYNRAAVELHKDYAVLNVVGDRAGIMADAPGLHIL